ncbi:UNVERIFIED_CONTAM: hypothetical protein Cloal_0459 [Acetivibrio alkalicellulosi]
MIGCVSVGSIFLFDLFKAIGVIAIFTVIMGFLSLLLVYISEKEDLGERSAKYSTSMGNALLVLHSFFEPGKKAQTEQVVWMKKRRTSVEKNFLGLSSLGYDSICIKGYTKTQNKKYKKKY